MDLPRINVTSYEFVPLPPAARLTDAEQLVANIATNMPSRMELRQLFDQKRLIAARLITAREILRHRIVELSLNACNCFRSGQAVSGTVLTRASFETCALLFHIDKRTSDAVQKQTLDDLGEFLIRVVVGAKGNSKLPEAINVLTSISDHLDKRYKGMKDLYATLCEITHPNQLGGLIAYGEVDDELSLNLGLKPQLAKMVFPMLAGALKLFEFHYNHLAEIYPALMTLCVREHPNGEPVPPKPES